MRVKHASYLSKPGWEGDISRVHIYWYGTLPRPKSYSPYNDLNRFSNGMLKINLLLRQAARK
jgi:hypothetical protein